MESETQYTYFKVEFKNCNLEYDYTIVENISDIEDYIQLVETELDDPASFAEIIITGIGMTQKQFSDWHKENVKP